MVVLLLPAGRRLLDPLRPGCGRALTATRTSHNRPTCITTKPVGASHSPQRPAARRARAANPRALLLVPLDKDVPEIGAPAVRACVACGGPRLPPNQSFPGRQTVQERKEAPRKGRPARDWRTAALLRRAGSPRAASLSPGGNGNATMGQGAGRMYAGRQRLGDNPAARAPATSSTAASSACKRYSAARCNDAMPASTCLPALAPIQRGGHDRSPRRFRN